MNVGSLVKICCLGKAAKVVNFTHIRKIVLSRLGKGVSKWMGIWDECRALSTSQYT